MKSISVCVLFVFTAVFCTAMQPSPYGEEWSNDYVATLKRAKASGKPAFVYFSGSNWCGFCKRFTNQVLSTDEFKAFAKNNLELVNLDFPKPAPESDKQYELNKWLQTQHGVSGFPTVLLLDADGVVLLRTGYRGEATGDFINLLKPYCSATVTTRK